MSAGRRESRAPLRAVPDPSSRLAPPSVSGLVPRPRVAALLDAAAATLVCAAAGWGKSLAVAQWCAGLPVVHAGRVGRPGRGHPGPCRVLVRGGTGRSLSEGAGRPSHRGRWVLGEGLCVLRPPRPARPCRCAGRRARDASGAVVLVLDGLDRVTDPEVHAALESLVRARVAGLTPSSRRDTTAVGAAEAAGRRTAHRGPCGGPRVRRTRGGCAAGRGRRRARG